MRAQVIVLCALMTLSSSNSRGEIFRWDNGQLIPGTEGITPGPGVQLDHLRLEYADLSDCDLTGASFVHTNLTKADLKNADLTRAALDSSNAINANLSGANLTGATLRGSILTNANLMDAVVTGADFTRAAFSGFTIEHAYSTRSRRLEDLIDRLRAIDQLHAADRLVAAGWVIVPFNRGRQLRLARGLRPDGHREQSPW